MIESIEARKCEVEIDRDIWIDSEFSPSSNILDAAISLYGQHDVSAIKRHSSSLVKINNCVEIIKEKIRETRDNNSNSIIMISGAPGAGKTLVGLNIAFDEEKVECAIDEDIVECSEMDAPPWKFSDPPMGSS